MSKLRKRISLIYIALLIAASSCNTSINNSPKVNAPDLDWLSGHWINNLDSSALFFENWTKSNDGNLSGISFVMSKKDTVFYESIQLIRNDSGTFYNVTVPNQNNGNAIAFKFVATTNNTYIFENLKHDFPQRINYQLKNSDTLNAWIEGEVQGESRKEMFTMWRLK